MISAKPHSAFSWDFTVYEDETPVAEVDLAWIRERATVTIKEIDCEVYRESMAGAFVLAVDGHVLIRAQKASFFTRTFDITYDEHAYHLKAKSPFGRAFDLWQGDTVIGTVTPRSAFTRTLDADLPDGLPLVVRVFILWLVILLWKRAASSS